MREVKREESEKEIYIEVRETGQSEIRISPLICDDCGVSKYRVAGQIEGGLLLICDNCGLPLHYISQSITYHKD